MATGFPAAHICGRGGIGRLDGFRFRYLIGVRVRVPPPAPNKHDSFDTKVSETNGGYGITLYDEVHVHE